MSYVFYVVIPIILLLEIPLRWRSYYRYLVFYRQDVGTSIKTRNEFFAWTAHKGVIIRDIVIIPILIGVCADSIGLIASVLIWVFFYYPRILFLIGSRRYARYHLKQ